MQEPLEIAFHNLEPSASLEADIRDRFSKLEKLYERLTSCRVSVEAGEAYGGLDLAVYLGDKPVDDQLIQATAPTPIGG